MGVGLFGIRGTLKVPNPKPELHSPKCKVRSPKTRASGHGALTPGESLQIRGVQPRRVDSEILGAFLRRRGGELQENGGYELPGLNPKP